MIIQSTQLRCFYIATLFYLSVFSVKAQVVISGIEMPKDLTYIQAEPLELYGVGVRKFLWMDMYVGAIFLNEMQLKPNQIIEANKPMALRLHILSSLVSNKRIIKAIQEGFDNSTNGNLHKYQKRIDQMIGYFDEEIQPDDIIDLVYNTSGNTMIYRNKKQLGSINGLDFKQALFGVWLSDKAVDSNLKNELLKGI